MNLEEGVSRILVIAMDRLGDTIQSTPTFQALREAFPSATIDAVIISAYVDAFRQCPYVDRFISVDPVAQRNFHAEIEAVLQGAQASADLSTLAHRLIDGQYDRVVNLVVSPLGSWLATMSGARVMCGSYFTRQGEMLVEGEGFIHFVSLLDFRDQNPFNLVDLYRLNVAQRHGRPRCYVRAVDGAGPKGDGRPTVAINPGSSRAERRWLLSRFSELADALAEEGVRVVVVGSAADHDVCNEVANACRHRPEMAVGTMDIAEMAGWFKTIDCVVANDTGALHIAAAVEAKAVGIYGHSGRFVETSPYGSGHILVESTPNETGERSFARIDVESVKLATLLQLNKVSEAQAVEHWRKAAVVVARTRVEDDATGDAGGIFYERLTGETPDEASITRALARPLLSARWASHLTSTSALGNALRRTFSKPDKSVCDLALKMAQGCASFAHAMVSLATRWDQLAAAGASDQMIMATITLEDGATALSSNEGTTLLRSRASWRLKMVPFSRLSEFAPTRARILRETAEDAALFAKALIDFAERKD